MSEFLRGSAPQREHSEQESNGLMFYRCMLCAGVVSRWDIEKGGCPKCAGTRIRPTDLSAWEKIVQIAKHPKVWTWLDDAKPANIVDAETLK